MKKSDNPNQYANILCYLLIYLIGIYPLNSAFANPVVPNNSQTQVDILDDVPVINIAKPNNAGVSYNTYKDFNVEEQGLVLNNSLGQVTSEIIGDLDKNPNFTNKTAKLIINEVTNGNQSQLKGILEIAGDKAAVMISNPNGITCDGCGFFNLSNATLTTGKPTLNSEGFLDTLKVTKGKININGEGLDGSLGELSSIDIISRALELNSKIQAKPTNLTIIQGTNQINYQNGMLIGNIKGEGNSPRLAVDTKALGGMYANKINILATEDGVGVNLNDLRSIQGDITINVNGDVSLVSEFNNDKTKNRNILAKTDLNIGANNIIIGSLDKRTAKDNEKIFPRLESVSAGGSITLASKNKIENNIQLTAGNDLRLLGRVITNGNERDFNDFSSSPSISAGNNLWIQKNVRGDKSDLVKNIGARITTNSGDLIVRTKHLENKVISKFDRLTDYNDTFSKNKGFELAFSREGLHSWGNSYIYADILNSTNNIASKKDLILTGQDLNHSYISGLYYEPNPYLKITPQIKAENNLVVDFNKSVNINTVQLDDAYFRTDDQYAYRMNNANDDSISVEGNNVVLKANEINVHGAIKANNDLKFIANTDINAIKSELRSENEVSLIAGNNIDLRRLKLYAKSANLIAKEGNVKVYGISDEDSMVKSYTDLPYAIAGFIGTLQDLIVSAGKNITFENTKLIGKTQNMIFSANEDITIENNDKELKNYIMSPAHEQISKQILKEPFDLRSPILAKNLSMTAGKNLVLAGVQINCLGGLANNCGGNNDLVKVDATDSVNLTAGKGIAIGLKKFNQRYAFDWGNVEDLTTFINSGNIAINSGGLLVLQAAQINSKGSTSLLAGNHLVSVAKDYGRGDPDSNYFLDANLITSIKSDKDLALVANGDISTQGTDLISGRNLTVTSGNNISFDSVLNRKYSMKDDNYEHVTHKGTTLGANGLLTITSEGSILFKATKLAVEGLRNLADVSNGSLREAMASGTMDIAAKGGYLYAQALDETVYYESTATKRNWWGKKKEIKEINRTTTPVVTEFSASTGYINILSRDDSTFEASKIEAGKNTNLTSLQGKINFKAVEANKFKQTITVSKGFFIKQNDQGYQENKWILPQVNVGGTLTVNAAQGITSDIKAKNDQILEDAVTLLSTEQGMSWIKDINKRSDVQWNKVQDAYTEWNQTNKHLNPVVGAVIAVAVAAVTAGYAAPAAASLAGGSAVAQGAITAGMAAVASKAAVSVVENEGFLRSLKTWVIVTQLNQWSLQW
ncbi:filamentous hemagglutinin N-terminal domain-containing protein [Xenorhabdus griffiniae]|uniref:filamentous hemagglutinin N-terminal domain-containing protein n=1 Tax=Xenorhabdus griffiniae TaxID=351672 RepID=UPI002358CF8D|nr:filamentous hemagglutinin N-terminal domain-containing protein [Xenorhabdus griffiniae]MDC9604583.1 filamentous hemagglutinin N-terminal domain-containing protein [Xenorhabdus griffiniae]